MGESEQHSTHIAGLIPGIIEIDIGPLIGGTLLLMFHLHFHVVFLSLCQVATAVVLVMGSGRSRIKVLLGKRSIGSEGEEAVEEGCLSESAMSCFN